MATNPENLYVRLGNVVALMPDIRANPSSAETLQWCGRAYALVAELGDRSEADAWKHAATALQARASASFAAIELQAILYRALAVAEMNAPAAIQGAFIPAGNAFDAMAAVGKVLQEAKQTLLIVDPYMDEKVLTDFAGLAPEGVVLQLMADQKDHKPTLKPAVTRWAIQHGAARPVEARLAAPRSLHDRLIVVDGAGAWTLTQSFNHFAARSPASIVRVDAETAALKASAYEGMWQAASPL